MLLDEITLATWRNMLRALDAMLGKARDQGDGLLAERLAPDMLPLSTQLRFVCNMPGEALVRLTAMEFTSHEDEPQSLADARARIGETLALLETMSGSAFADETKRIEMTLPNAMVFELSAAEYVRDWALPNFYFHVSTAYAIMRANAVPLGKADFLPHMAKYAKAPPS